MTQRNSKTQLSVRELRPPPFPRANGHGDDVKCCASGRKRSHSAGIDTLPSPLLFREIRLWSWVGLCRAVMRS